MARDIQPQANEARGAEVKAFVGLIATAIFWLVVAIVFPVRIVPQLVPELAMGVDWLPIMFYGLAAWNFIRALRSLRGLTGSVRRRVNGPARAASARNADSSRAMPAATRVPTVQRMR
jgi:hypothetical protein